MPPAHCILTATGEARMIESLLQGDVVLTLSSEGTRRAAGQVDWPATHRYRMAHPRPETVAPIRIQRGAFADNVPHSDLLPVSPDHGILVDDKLICARQLINGTTISQEANQASVEYFHVELDAHAILLAEGLPAESYLDTTGNRNFLHQLQRAARAASRFDGRCPDYTTREAASCKPFVWDEGSVRPGVAAPGRANGRRSQSAGTEAAHDHRRGVVHPRRQGADTVATVCREQCWPSSLYRRTPPLCA